MSKRVVTDNRSYSIDTLRFFANFSVVLTHTAVVYAMPTPDMHGLLLWISFIVYEFTRLALPFFFIFAGFFYSKSLLKGASLKDKYQKAIRKLVTIFVCFVALYALFPSNGKFFLANVEEFGWIKAYYWQFQSILLNPLFLILRGTKYHLWFLPALMIGLSVVTIFHHLKKEKFLIYVFIFFSWLMMAVRPVFDEIAFSNIKYGSVHGICKAIAYVTCGYLMAKVPRWENKTALRFLAFGVTLVIIQAVLVTIYRLDIDLGMQLGTMPCAIGIFLLALNHPTWGKDHFFSKFGLLTLWIYGFHPFILDQVKPFGQYVHPVIWSLLFPIAVYGISLVITLLIQQLLTIRRTNAAKATKVEFL